MNDVQRVQRLFPQIASSVSSARDTRTGVPDARSHAKRVAEVCRSGSILAADCVAFVASAALGLMSFLLSRQTGLSAAPSYKASAYALLLTMGADKATGPLSRGIGGFHDCGRKCIPVFGPLAAC